MDLSEVSTAELLALRDEFAQGSVTALLTARATLLKYSPDQPREPAGTPEGGEFAGGSPARTVTSEEFDRLAATGNYTVLYTGYSGPKNRMVEGKDRPADGNLGRGYYTTTSVGGAKWYAQGSLRDEYRTTGRISRLLLPNDTRIADYFKMLPEYGYMKNGVRYGDNLGRIAREQGYGALRAGNDYLILDRSIAIVDSVVRTVADIEGTREVERTPSGGMIEHFRWDKVATVQKFSEDQPRDDHGRWTSGGGGDLPSNMGDLAHWDWMYREDRIVEAWVKTFAGARFIQENPKSELAQEFAKVVAAQPPVEGTVYRGVAQIGTHGEGELQPAESRALWESRVGETLVMHNPVSTTTEERIAAKFGDVIFAIDQNGVARDLSRIAPAGYRTLSEAVMPPGKFRVTGVEPGPPITDTIFGPINPRESTVVHLQDVTEGPRQYYSDRSGPGAHSTSVVKMADPGDSLRRFIAVEGETGGYEMLFRVVKYSDDEPRDYHGRWTGGVGEMDAAATRAGLGIDDFVRQRFSDEAARGVASAIDRVQAAFPGALKGVSLFTKAQAQMDSNFGPHTAGATSPGGQAIFVSDKAGTVAGFYDPKADHSFTAGGDTTEGIVLHEFMHAALDSGKVWAMSNAPWSAYRLANSLPPITGYARLDNGNGHERAAELLTSALLGQGIPEATQFYDAVKSGYRAKIEKRTRTIRVTSGGPRRDRALNPIIAKLKADLIALADYHGNRRKFDGATLWKYSDDQPRDDHGRWTSEGSADMVSPKEFRGEYRGHLYAKDKEFGPNGLRALGEVVALNKQLTIPYVRGGPNITFIRDGIVDARVAARSFGAGINLSPAYFGANSHWVGHDDGFHPDGTATPEGFLAHEYGHVVDWYLRGQDDGHSLAEKADGWTSDATKAYDAWRQTAVDHPVSGYARSDDKEAVAEAFSAAFASTSTAQDLAPAAALRDLFTKYGVFQPGGKS